MGGKGKKRPNYGVGRSVMNTGYVRIWEPTHPLANSDGYVLEHRKVVYDVGVEIPEGCYVHHVNENKQDNRLENLAVMQGSEHTREHVHGRGEVTNQFGTWPLLTDAERLAKQRENAKKTWGAYAARKRAEQEATP